MQTVKKEKKIKILPTGFLTVPNAVTQMHWGKPTCLFCIGIQLSMPVTHCTQTLQGSQKVVNLKEVQYQSILAGSFKIKSLP